MNIHRRPLKKECEHPPRNCERDKTLVIITCIEGRDNVVHVVIETLAFRTAPFATEYSRHKGLFLTAGSFYCLWRTHLNFRI